MRKKISIKSFFNAAVFLLIVCSIISSQAAPKNNEILNVDLKYSRLLDKVCENHNNLVISQEAIDELNDKTIDFQKAWDSEAPRLLTALYELTGNNFKHRDIFAAMVLCPRMPSMSHPLTINMGFYLNSTRPHPTPTSYFVGIVLHEVLHTFVVENLAKDKSIMLKKYSHENPRTLGHLHVTALQIAIYKNLGLIERLNQTREFERRFGDDYIRAWQIVSDIEGPDRFLDEVSSSWATVTF